MIFRNSRRCGNAYNWLCYETVGNSVCRMWESPWAFPCAVNVFSINGMACYAYFHSVKSKITQAEIGYIPPMTFRAFFYNKYLLI